MTNSETGLLGTEDPAQRLHPLSDQNAVFRIEVNRQEFHLGDPLPTGRQILATAGFEPPDEHVLIEVQHLATKAIGLDEDVDLRALGRDGFRAFRSDRLFLFTVSGHGYVWGDPTITETELRLLADVPADEVLVLERDNAAELILSPGELVRLSMEGTEHLHAVKKVVHVFIDDQEKEIPRGTYTTKQLLDVLKVRPGYLLNLVDEKGQLQPLQPGERVHVKDGLRFYSQAPGGGSS